MKALKMKRLIPFLFSLLLQFPLLANTVGFTSQEATMPVGYKERI
jgi:hypothetical protein